MEMMVDRVGIILDGEIRKQGKLADLISHSVRYYEMAFTGINQETLAEKQLEYSLRDNDYIMQAQTSDDVNQIIHWLTSNNAKIHSVTPVKRTLEDIFLEETQKNSANHAS
jgi:ABC-type multidrug transport system ATPase subunit